MLQNTVVLSLIFLIFTGCVNHAFTSQKSITGNGNIVTETRDTGHFSELRITGARNTVVYGDKDGPIRITGDSNILENLSSSVENGRLVITSATNHSLHPTQRVEIEIPSSHLNGIRISGSNRLILKNIEQESMWVRGSGSTKIEADGYAGHVEIRLSGSSKIDASKLVSESAVIRTSGSSNAEIYVSDLLESRSSGSSRIIVHGHPKEISNQSSGSSRLRTVSKNESANNF